MLQLVGHSHVSKSPSESAPRATAASFSLTSFSLIMASSIPLITRVDVWFLRCLFNRARLFERWQGGEFDSPPPVRRAVRPGSADAPPDAAYSVGVYYYDRVTGEQIAYVRCHQKADFTIAGTGQHDPKVLRMNDIEYHQHQGGRWWEKIRRDPSTLFKRHGLPYRAYTNWRRLKCALFHR